MEIKSYAHVTPPQTWASESSLATDKPALTMKLQANTDIATAWSAGETCNTNSRLANVCFDIHPGSAYAYGSSAADMSDSAGVENVVIDSTITAESTDICTEKW